MLIIHHARAPFVLYSRLCLVSWVCEMNERYGVEGEGIFVPGMRQRGQLIDSELKDSDWAHPKKNQY